MILSSNSNDINANDWLGGILFQAPNESGGSAALLAGASIFALQKETLGLVPMQHLWLLVQVQMQRQQQEC